MVYFSNGCEGMVLDDQCQRCLLGQDACPVYLVQLQHNYDQVEEDKQQEHKEPHDKES